jgi:DNA-binding MarR family transcriptional regulator
MATRVKKFAEQAIKVEQAVRQRGIPKNAARVVFVLAMADRRWGTSQKDVVDRMALRKDVVSKLVSLLVKARMLSERRDSSNVRVKTLFTSQLGKQLLSRVEAWLQPPPPEPRPKQEFMKPCESELPWE